MTDYVAQGKFTDLINAANEDNCIDWLTDALHAVVEVCFARDTPVSNQVLEAIRYELTAGEATS